ncbi:MAG: HEPN domain-containing protein [Thermomicrobiales bacterium]
MKDQTDLVRGWLRKARSDFTAIEALIAANTLDAACFHAQQAAEKYLKAYLAHANSPFPSTHNLVKLVELCLLLDGSFATMIHVVTPLVPYAVELRYDAEFWPDEQTAREARVSALAIEQFVLARLPKNITDSPGALSLDDRNEAI